MNSDQRTILEDLIKEYEKKIKDVVNPDNIQSWGKLGFDEAPDGYETIEEFLEGDGCELDERGQVTLQCYYEVIEII